MINWTLPLSVIWKKWRDALKIDADIRAFCLEKYGKAPKFFVGVDIKDLPKKEDCPFIMLRPGVKSEGVNLPENSYMIPIGWCILNPNKIVTGDVIECAGLEECDQLGQLIITCIASVEAKGVVSSIQYDIEGVDHFPQIPGEMALQVDLPIVIGSELDY
jgi:hypothetical protein